MFRASSGSTTTLKDPARWLVDWFGGGRDTASGVQVSEETATRSIAVLAAIKIISEDVASLPLITYRRLSSGGKERATDHPLFKVLHHQPNPEMTAMQLRETLQAHLGLRGNAFAEIVRDGGGRVRELWPITPTRVARRRIDGELVYDVSVGSGIGDGNRRLLAKERVLDLRGLSLNGLEGLSPIGEAREAVGLAIATERYGAAFFGNRADPGGILEHPGQLSDKAYARIKDSWTERHKGLNNAQRMTILEEGMKWERIGIPPEDAQFLQTRKFQVTEIARLYRIPPHKLGDLERATFSNVEQQSIDYVTDTLRPWLIRWEQEILTKLFSDDERETYFAEHLIAGLLRGDTKTRNEGYAVGRQWGWLSADDIREMENMNPLADGKGKSYLVPMNMVEVGSPAAADTGTQPEPAPTPADLEGRAAGQTKEVRAAAHRRRIQRSFEPIFKATAARVLRRERNDIMRQAKKLLAQRDAQEFEHYLGDFYIDHRSFVQREFQPAIEGLSDAIAPVAATEVGNQPVSLADIQPIQTGYGEAMSKRYADSSHGQLRQVVRKAVAEKRDPIAALDKRFDEWDERRPEKVAKRETVQEGNFITRAVWRRVGVLTIRWITFGDNCSYCDNLNGKSVEINSAFVAEGEGLLPAGATHTLTTFTNIGHPPLHQGCDCGIAPA